MRERERREKLFVPTIERASIYTWPDYVAQWNRVDGDVGVIIC